VHFRHSDYYAYVIAHLTDNKEWVCTHVSALKFPHVYILLADLNVASRNVVSIRVRFDFALTQGRIKL